jgi:hypothetical protein
MFMEWSSDDMKSKRRKAQLGLRGKGQQWCIFHEYGDMEIEQTAWSCHTCRLDDECWICNVCARICHAGHDVKCEGTVKCICSCGARYGDNCCCCMTGEEEEDDDHGGSLEEEDYSE